MGQLQPKLRGGIVFSVKKIEDRIKLERIDFPLRSEIENDYKSISESCEGQRNIDSSPLYPKKVSWKNGWWFLFRTKVVSGANQDFVSRQRKSALLSGHLR